MKKSTTKWLLVLCTAITLFSCKEAVKDDEVVVEEETKTAYTPITNEDLENAVIYEANIRQYSEAGTFNEFTKDIPELKKLGVKVIWLMPVFPISEVNRKAKGDLMVHDIKDPEERAKYLGSYYAVADYEKVNPDLGTKDDLDKLIQTAHENGMYVILDWVANHTGWDNWWIDEHPDFYTKDENGNMMHPKGTDWTDTADLNYENEALWEAMTSSMVYWVKNHNIDGFRCDVAHEVPTEFWNYATKSIRSVKPVFMLAESEKKDLFLESFDMGYNWEGHHIMNELAQSKIPATKWDEYMLRVQADYQEDDILMNFITNHDENSWNGTVQERMGKASDAMLAFQYMIPGMPLIYSGQEYGMNKRLKFFEKDTIPHEKGREWKMMEKLGKLKATNPALHGGKNAASYRRINTSEDSKIYAIEREKNGNKVIYVANFSDEFVEFTAPISGVLTDVVRGGEANIPAGYTFTFPAYGYRVWEVAK
ncbi:alpha-amylase family glycosyl hydrolase [Nonlabens sp.]|uniref:alpha-amylase family glycosyl hydrolase n=1 Tax=Nonlabens sp. TaxID=1888209 RepID=UPI003F697DBD